VIQRLMYPHWVMGWVVALTLSLSSTAWGQDDAQRVFDSLYGSRVQQAMRTGTTADDVALARELLEAARTSTGTPKLLAILCEQAYALGSRDREGIAVADEAMQVLATAAPQRRG